MAIMYPEELPSKVKSPAEQKLYDIFKNHLPKEFTVLWSVSLTTSLRGGGKGDREIDFLVLHPQKGILNLEVKGGKIRYDRNLNQWYSIDHSDRENPIYPFEQAKDCMYELIRRLKEGTNAPLREPAPSAAFLKCDNKRGDDSGDDPWEGVPRPRASPAG